MGLDGKVRAPLVSTVSSHRNTGDESVTIDRTVCREVLLALHDDPRPLGPTPIGLMLLDEGTRLSC